MPKNTDILLKLAIKHVGLVGLVFCGISAALQEWTLINSALLGSLFSFLTLRQLILSQHDILKQRNKGLFFRRYTLRLVLYAIPVSLALWQREQFNFAVTLIFLFAFQVHFVILVSLVNWKKYKKRVMEE